MEHVTTTDGIRIAISVHDAPARAAKTRLALVHSLAMTRSFWDPLVERLAGDASIVTIDARGHGDSDKPPGPYTAERMAQDLRDVIDALGWDRVSVAGASMGGCVALQFAGSLPDRTAGLGLIDTTAWYGAEAPKDWATRAAKARSEGLGALVDFQRTRWFSDAFRARESQIVERCVETFLRNDVDAFASACHMLGAFDGRSFLRGISVPTTVIVGEEDYAAPVAMAEALHQGIPGSRLTIIPSARHLTPLETPDVVADELRAILRAAAT